MDRAALASFAVFLGLAACRTDTQPIESPQPAQTHADDISAEVAQEVVASMDRGVGACEDFYRFACGGWIDATELPADEPRFGRFHVLRERNVQALRAILDQTAAQQPQTPLGTFYAACMDEEQVAAGGVQSLQPMLQQVEIVEDPASFLRASGALQRYGVPVLIGMGVGPDYGNPDLNIAHLSQGGLGLPDRDYYLGDSDKQKAVREGYSKHVRRMFELVGHKNPEAAAASVLGFETELAKLAMPRDQLRNPENRHNRMTPEELASLTPSLPWAAFFEAIGAPGVSELNVAPPGFFEGLQELVPNTKPAVLRDYLHWHVVHAYADHLGPELVQADFEFFGKTLRGQQSLSPRWKRCVKTTDSALGEMLGEIYVGQHFAGDARGVALEMIHGIESAFAKGLDDLSWMDDATRERALEKMKAVVNKVGYPERWKDYAGLELSGAHAENVAAANQFEFDREIKKVGQPVDKGEWHMTPPTVNAYYNPPNNEMVFPAGILQPPFFHPNYPMAMNFGGIGMVMGHELTHGFDDSGRKFDGTGRLRQWWDPSAVERFEERAECVENLYSSYEVQPGLTLNGKLTLGENIADFGGIKQAHSAYVDWATENGVDPRSEALGGLTREQLFFVSFGQLWCTKATPEVEQVLALTDPHSHPRYRVNGPLSNLPAFWEAFRCEPGEPMRPKNTCEVW